MSDAEAQSIAKAFAEGSLRGAALAGKLKGCTAEQLGAVVREAAAFKPDGAPPAPKGEESPQDGEAGGTSEIPLLLFDLIASYEDQRVSENDFQKIVESLPGEVRKAVQSAIDDTKPLSCLRKQAAGTADDPPAAREERAGGGTAPATWGPSNPRSTLPSAPGPASGPNGHDHGEDFAGPAVPANGGAAAPPVADPDLGSRPALEIVAAGSETPLVIRVDAETTRSLQSGLVLFREAAQLFARSLPGAGALTPIEPGHVPAQTPARRHAGVFLSVSSFVHRHRAAFATTAIMFVVAAVVVGFLQLRRLQALAEDASQRDRALGLKLQIDKFWEETLDADTRHRCGRFIQAMKPTRLTDADRLRVIECFVDEEKGNAAESIRADKTIMPILELDASAPPGQITARVAEYRMAIIKYLNTMESVASIRSHSRNGVANQLIDEGYRDTVQRRTADLLPYIKSYRRFQQDDEEAWKPLTDLVLNGEWAGLSASPAVPASEGGPTGR